MDECKTIPNEILGSSKSDLIQSTNCPHYSARHSTERFDDPFPLSVPEREVEFTEERERHIAERHPDPLPEHRSRIEKTLADLRLAATRRGPGAMGGARARPGPSLPGLKFRGPAEMESARGPKREWPLGHRRKNGVARRRPPRPPGQSLPRAIGRGCRRPFPRSPLRATPIAQIEATSTFMTRISATKH